jgi:propanol-preferring alcohol dehydrogenase
MKAMVLRKFGEPMEYLEIEKPSIGEQDVLLRVKACGLCGTDLKIFDGKVPTVKLPSIMGHEVSGVVEEVGRKVKMVRPGDHGVVHIYITCGSCFYCRNSRENDCQSLEGRIGFELPGGFGEYLRVPEKNFFTVSPKVPLDEVSILSGSVSTPMHGVRTQGRLRMGETAVIIGIGGLGIHTLQLAVNLGARVIAVDIDDRKLEVARSCGADAVINSSREDFPAAVRDITGGLGADLAVEVIGGPKIPEVLEESIKCLRLGGRLVIMGYDYGQRLAIDPQKIVYDELEIIGTRSSTRQDLIDVISLVERGKVKPLITERVPLEQANGALRRLRHSEAVGRMVLVL